MSLKIVKAKFNEVSKADPLSAQPFVDVLRKVQGVINGYYGLEAQDPSTWCLFLSWENIERHVELIANTTAYAPVIDTLNQFANELAVFHTNFTTDPHAVFTSPLSELIVYTAKEGVSREDTVLPELKRVTEFLVANGARVAAYGPAVEDEKKAAVVVGWDSLDKFNAARQSERAQGASGKFHELVDIEITLATLTSFK